MGRFDLSAKHGSSKPGIHVAADPSRRRPCRGRVASLLSKVRAMPAYEIAAACPVCSAREDEEIASADDVRAEVEALWAFHTRRLRPGTPPERLADRVAFSQRPPLRLVRCCACGLVFRNPRERAWELTDTYAGETPAPGVLRALFETQRTAYQAQAARLTQVAARPGRGLEVGSYVGGFLDASRALGWHFEGLDVNAPARAFVCALGHVVHEGTIEAFAEGTDASYDAVAFWNCLDQLPDPRAALGAAARLTRPGGVLAVRVPNGSFYARVRRRLRGPLAPAARALLAHNNLLAFPYRFGFTVPSLTRLFAATGFRVTRVHGDTLVPIGDAFTRRWAVWEERALKAAVRAGVREAGAPWIEIFGARQ